MEKIKRVSQIFQKFFLILVLIMPLVPFWGWFFLDVNDTSFQEIFVQNRGINIMAPLTIWSQVLGFTASMLPVGAQMLIYYFLYQLFALYAEGKIFRIENIRYIRKLGFAMVGEQVALTAYGVLSSMILTMNNPPGQKQLMLSISFNSKILLIALLITVVTWIMEEGRKLQEQDDYTV